ncbi:penicillin-binding protein 1A [Ruminococcus sp. YE71]|uniref:transglycosylase domain-containing protein n=1 Tax=unclassified Ruminococcus TaxID=2608920 RepID=UPI00088C6961|nr:MULTISPECIES: transglycosylase domain-containing protein [unclassified Ruminococcus]SDA27834.1 penicillin-binding protein 1A [Ruminococcus sp. YE78]SFW46322.1 penicillin-binding protein 1A [Ruminococcus sp. YE71]
MEEKRNGTVRRQRPKPYRQHPMVTILKVVATLMLSALMVIVITGSIFATALTIYILNFADTTTTVNLDEEVVTSNVTRFFYKNPDYDPDDEDSEEWIFYYGLKNQQRKAVWVDLKQVPTYAQDSFVCAEDERFYTHDGVDFKRTLASIIKTLLGAKQGGSTITQQTIKNITKDNSADGAEGVERKIREIFRAINVEKVYTKDDILEAYVNVVEFGTSQKEIIGVEQAANYYFCKDVSELNYAEAASLAAMLKAPADLNPLEHPDKNMDRLKYVLRQMNDNGTLSDDEWAVALKQAEKLEVIGDPEFSSIEEDNEIPEDQGETDWFMDAALNQAEELIADQKGISVEDARARLYSGGYDVYTTVDIKMQREIEKKMKDNTCFQEWSFDGDKLLAGFCVVDYKGNVLVNVSSRKKKKESRIFNLVSQGERSPGSCIKPIASYAPALDQDLITYSKFMLDSPPLMLDADGDGVEEKWPVNYSEFGESANWSNVYIPAWQMLARSLNTCPAELVKQMTPAYCFNFLREKLDITTLVDGKDSDYSGMTVGGLNHGLHLQELVAAYTIFGNGGKKYPTTYISLLQEVDGTVVYEHGDGYKQAINDSTSYIMNKMMQKAVTDTNGTARYAKLKNTVLAAKTGTSSDWIDLNFVGCTPDYVSGVWIGFEKWNKIPTNEYHNIGEIWLRIFGDIAENETHHDFQMPDSVQMLKYCTKTGDIAGTYCGSTDVGYYKTSYIPQYCSGWH